MIIQKKDNVKQSHVDLTVIMTLSECTVCTNITFHAFVQILQTDGCVSYRKALSQNLFCTPLALEIRKVFTFLTERSSFAK